MNSIKNLYQLTPGLDFEFIKLKNRKYLLIGSEFSKGNYTFISENNKIMSFKFNLSSEKFQRNIKSNLVYSNQEIINLLRYIKINGTKKTFISLSRNVELINLDLINSILGKKRIKLNREITHSLFNLIILLKDFSITISDLKMEKYFNKKIFNQYLDNFMFGNKTGDFYILIKNLMIRILNDKVFINSVVGFENYLKIIK